MQIMSEERQTSIFDTSRLHPQLLKKRKRNRSTIETHGVTPELLNMVRNGMLTLVQAKKIYEESINGENLSPSSLKKSKYSTSTKKLSNKLNQAVPGTANVAVAVPLVNTSEKEKPNNKMIKVERKKNTGIKKYSANKIQSDNSDECVTNNVGPVSSAMTRLIYGSPYRSIEATDEIRKQLVYSFEKNIMRLTILDVRSNNIKEKVLKMRLCGEPFVLVGHDKFTEFSSSWNMSSKSRNALDTSRIPLSLRKLLVPVIKKGERSATSFHPINSKISFEKYLETYWKKSNPSCYLHQWQFPIESKIARKYIGAKHVNDFNKSTEPESSKFRSNSHLPTCMDIDLLEYWRTDLDGENPFQYIFAGAQSTGSMMHHDPGGMGIFIAPVCGKKELTLIHRNDGSRLYEMSPWENDGFDLDFQKYPTLQFARVWRHVLKPGDVAYLPAGTYHSVKNTEACLSYHRFHLDEVNLPFFFNSLYAGDAPEIDHYEVVWNSIHGIMSELQSLEQIGQGIGKSSSRRNRRNNPNVKNLQHDIDNLRSLLIRLRQISCAIYDQEHKEEWYDIVQDIDLILSENHSETNHGNGNINTDTKLHSSIHKTQIITRDSTERRDSTQSLNSIHEISDNSKKNDRHNLNSKAAADFSHFLPISGKVNSTTSLFKSTITKKTSISTLNKSCNNNSSKLWEIGRQLTMERFGQRKKGEIVGVRTNVSSWKCRYKGWQHIYDEYVPIENIKSLSIQPKNYKKHDKVFVQWGETGESYEARLLKFHQGTLINIYFPDLGQDWNTWLPENVVRSQIKKENEMRQKNKMMEDSYDTDDEDNNIGNAKDDGIIV